MQKELIELGQCRLDRGWTYRQLAAEINKVSAVHLGHARLFTLLNDVSARPNDLTLHGIRKFLQSLKTKRRKRRPSAQEAVA